MKDLKFTPGPMVSESNSAHVLGIVSERIQQLSTLDLSQIAGAWAHQNYHYDVDQETASSNATGATGGFGTLKSP